MTVRRQKTADTEAEKKRVEDALTKAKEQLAFLYEKALKEVGWIMNTCRQGLPISGILPDGLFLLPFFPWRFLSTFTDR